MKLIDNFARILTLNFVNVLSYLLYVALHLIRIVTIIYQGVQRIAFWIALIQFASSFV